MKSRSVSALPTRKVSAVSSVTPVYTTKPPTGHSSPVYYEALPRVGILTMVSSDDLPYCVQASASSNYIHDPRGISNVYAQENYKVYSTAGPSYITQQSPQLIHTYTPDGDYHPVRTICTTVSRGPMTVSTQVPSRMSVLATEQQPPYRQTMQPLMM